MKIISDFGKGLDTLSAELQSVPAFVYLLIIILIFFCMIFYVLVIPRLHISSGEKRRWKRGCVLVLMVVYMICILAITVFTREYTDTYRMQLIPFNGLKNFDYINRTIIRDGANFLLFVPLGIFFAWQHRQKRIFLDSTGFSLAFSLTVELFQLGSRLGTFDVDDLIFNTLGGMIGALLVYI